MFKVQKLYTGWFKFNVQVTIFGTLKDNHKAVTN